MDFRISQLDEFPLQNLPGTPLWSESYAFMFGDPIKKTAIFYHCSRWYADPTIWREIMGIVVPGGRVFSAKNYGRNESPAGPGASLSSLSIIEPGRQLRLKYDGPLLEHRASHLYENANGEGPKTRGIVDLTFDEVSPVLDMKGDSSEAALIAGSLHIDQIGKANGTIFYDGKTHDFKNAYCVRDHSRGTRDSTLYGRHCWLNGHLSGDRFFYLYVMALQGKSKFGMSNAVIIDSGKPYEATLLHSDLWDDPTNPTKLHSFVLGSDLGEMKVQVKEIITTFPNSIVAPFDVSAGWITHTNSGKMLDQLVIYESDGRTGPGWNERGLATQPL